MQGYQSKNWQAFRREVIELDGNRCNQCQRDETEVVLQVHHRKYIAGRLPWQYDYQDCETMCRGCHAAEHGKVPPKTGWQYLGYEDLGEVSSNCELCGSNFRYQFYVYHKNWGSMLVGAYCSDALTGSNLASNKMSMLQKCEDRRVRFVQSRRWIKTLGRYIIRQKDIRIEIFRDQGLYRIQLDKFPGREKFQSLKDAKNHVFDVIEDGSAEQFLIGRGVIHGAQSNRQSVRLRGYDYSQAGLYFITICSHHQKCVFGKILDSNMQLSAIGKLVDSQWRSMAKVYMGVRMHEYVVMPNHLHGIVEILDDAGAMNRAPTVGEIVRGFKARCTRLGEFNQKKGKIWQRNYFEHIIRSEQSYLKISEYIQNNPASWRDDGYYVEM